MKEKFTKKDLKNLMVVEMRNGWKAVVIDDELVGKDGYMQLDGYDDNLKRIRPVNSYDFDIVKVWAEYCGLGAGFNIYIDEVNKDSSIIWERKEKKEIKLSDAERAWLTVAKHDGKRYIARDYDGGLYTYSERPTRGIASWHPLGANTYKKIWSENLFEFITFYDNKPYLIEDLLKL